MHWLRRIALAALAAGLGLVGIGDVGAQDGGADCPAVFDEAVTAAFDHCFTMENGTVCAASGDVRLTLAGGETLEGAGSSAPFADVTRIEAGDGAAWSIARAYAPDKFNPDTYATLLLLGPATLERDSAGAENAFTLSADPDGLACAELAQPGLLVQSPELSLTQFTINGVGLTINGLLLIHPADDGITVRALTRETIIETGAVVFTGYETTAAGESAPEIVPYDAAAVAHLPVILLPRPVLVGLPGNATVAEQTVLHLRPHSSAYTGQTVRVGGLASVFGQDASGEWLYIRTYDDRMGWVPRAALTVDVPGEIPVIETPPTLPTRPFGPVYAYGRTNSQANNLRNAPSQMGEIVATVPYGTELAIYGRSAADDWLLVELPDGVRAWISNVLVDFQTPIAPGELPLAPEA